MGGADTRERRRGGSLARRTIAVSLLLSAVIGTAFLLLSFVIDALRHLEDHADHSLEVLVAANVLERRAIDVETTERGFVITGDPQFLEPWRRAQAKFTEQAAVLERLAMAGDMGQVARAHEITTAGESYINDYSIPLVATAQRDLNSARTVAVTEEGKQRIDALRTRFELFMARENQIFMESRDRAEASATRAFAAASVSVGGSIVFIMFSGGYLSRSVIRPVRQAAGMAGRVADGDLTVRMPETGPAEVGSLERSFNSMADSLETSHDQLRHVADEQAALRRVATLVARGVPPPEVFGAVAGETGRVLGAKATGVVRFEPDGTATVAGSWDRPGTEGLPLPPGSHWPAPQESLAGRVLRTGEPARVPDYDREGGIATAWGREFGIRSAVGSPIIVEGRLWGAIMAFSDTVAPDQDDTAERLHAFTELVAMAVANTESRAQLAASRARVVAAADETRRRIERDLHDGTQQRLISLALELRAAEARVPPEQRSFVVQWSRTAQALNEVVEELREISRGLHPATLERGGLDPALRALARRAGVPVVLNVTVSGRLPERIEVAAYYAVSEALTNAAKHARASRVEVDVGMADDTLRLQIRDDGVGGADPSRGSGLIGLSDRVEAVGGRIEITSPPGEGTTLVVTIPVPLPSEHQGT
jgi:signal transduction histidine kinase